MKTYIEDALEYHSLIFKTPADVVEHMFATLGNGVNLNNKGYLSDNDSCDEVYPFPEPQPLKYIYPWTDTERYQPFRDLAGCRDLGFKDAAQYFIDCIKITPDSVDGISGWKENLNIVEDVLLNTPAIVEEYASVEVGYPKFLSKLKCKSSIDNIQDGTPIPQQESVSKRWFFDVQWSDCPDFVESEVRHLWGEYGLGNDNYIVQKELDDELFNTYPNIYYWLMHKGVEKGDKVIIHWWW